jgi:chorismate-pyruvate lyase
MHEDEMFDLEHVRELDSLIMREIVLDIISGTLLVKADSETLEMVLTNIWEMRESYTRAGVIVGDA